MSHIPYEEPEYFEEEDPYRDINERIHIDKIGFSKSHDAKILIFTDILKGRADPPTRVWIIWPSGKTVEPDHFFFDDEHAMEEIKKKWPDARFI